jgi:hypothetical protein
MSRLISSSISPSISFALHDPMMGLDAVLLSDEERIEQDELLMLIDENAEQFRKDFRQWFVNNWPVWECFEEKANDVWLRGRMHYSARTLIEVVRHETFLREAGSEKSGSYKINNSYVPDIGRLYCLKYPMRPGFFETRSLGTECVRKSIRA